MLMGGVAFLLMPVLLLGGLLPAFAAVVVTVVAADATVGPFWTWVHLAAPAGAGAVSLAAVNSVGKAGGLLGPLSFGVMKHATGSYLPSILLVGGAMLFGSGMALGYRGPEHGGARPAEYSKLPCTQEMVDDEEEGSPHQYYSAGGPMGTAAAAVASGMLHRTHPDSQELELQGYDRK
jgi:hypothetical protein